MPPGDPSPTARRLVEGADLLLEQGEVVERIEDQVPSFLVRALVGVRSPRPRTEMTTSLTYPAQENLPVAVPRGHRVVVARYRSRATAT